MKMKNIQMSCTCAKLLSYVVYQSLRHLCSLFHCLLVSLCVFNIIFLSTAIIEAWLTVTGGHQV